MTKNLNHQVASIGEELDELEAKSESEDAADAPATAERVARLLGAALDEIEGGSGGGTP